MTYNLTSWIPNLAWDIHASLKGHGAAGRTHSNLRPQAIPALTRATRMSTLALSHHLKRQKSKGSAVMYTEGPRVLPGARGGRRKTAACGMSDMSGRVSEAIRVWARTNSRVLAGRTLGLRCRDVAYPTAILSAVNAHQSRASRGRYTDGHQGWSGACWFV